MSELKKVEFLCNLSQTRTPVSFDRYDDGADAVIHIPKSEEIGAYRLATMRNKKLRATFEVVGNEVKKR